MLSASSTRTLRTTRPSGPVWWVTRVMPIIFLVRSAASSASLASFTPPPLPRPPAWICAFTTTRPPNCLAAARASSGVSTTTPRGVGFHFLIAFTATAVFYVASRKIGFLTEQPILAAVLYGIAVYLFMYLVVQQLAGLHPKFGLLTTSRAVLVHIFCVGLPIALSV